MIIIGQILFPDLSKFSASSKHVHVTDYVACEFFDLIRIIQVFFRQLSFCFRM